MTNHSLGEKAWIEMGSPIYGKTNLDEVKRNTRIALYNLLKESNSSQELIKNCLDFYRCAYNDLVHTPTGFKCNLNINHILPEFPIYETNVIGPEIPTRVKGEKESRLENKLNSLYKYSQPVSDLLTISGAFAGGFAGYYVLNLLSQENSYANVAGTIVGSLIAAGFIEDKVQKYFKELKEITRINQLKEEQNQDKNLSEELREYILTSAKNYGVFE